MERDCYTTHTIVVCLETNPCLGNPISPFPYLILPKCTSALIHDIRQSNFTTKPHFPNANYKFYRERIPKAAKKKLITLWKQHDRVWGLRKFLTNKAWWWIFSVWCNHAWDLLANQTLVLATLLISSDIFWYQFTNLIWIKNSKDKNPNCQPVEILTAS